MRVVVTGSSGQVVRSLVHGSGTNIEMIPLGRPQLDLTADRSAIIAAIVAARPGAIVSAAAYTAVDKAESEPDVAFAANAQGPAAVAAAARDLDVPLVHLSTDYVFDGNGDRPYDERDEPHPSTVYGTSKLAGEQAVLDEHDNVAVLRTAWVYSPFGSNFVKTMLNLAKTRSEIRVVADQLGNPTSALDIADAILKIITYLDKRAIPEQRGIFHMVGSGEASWADFAEGIFANSALLGGPAATVVPIATSEYPTPARRPANSRLDCSKLAKAHGVRLPGWKVSLPNVVGAITEAALHGARK